MHRPPALSNIRSMLLHAALFAIAALMLTPLLWLVCASFKTPEDMFAHVFLPWTDLWSLTLDNVRTLFGKEPFAVWMINSIFLASMHTVIVVALSSLGGFALAKYQFTGKKALMFVMLATMLLPGQVLLPSMYELMFHMKWIDSYLAILVPGAVSVFGMFLFRQAMLQVPDELLQAGRVDGCSEFRLWWEVALPIVRPMLGAFALLSFTSTWNSFLWPQIVLQDEAKYHLPIGLANMISLPEYQTQLGVLMAGTLFSVLPVMILFFALQREFVSGLTSGAVKG